MAYCACRIRGNNNGYTVITTRRCWEETVFLFNHVPTGCLGGCQVSSGIIRLCGVNHVAKNEMHFLIGAFLASTSVQPLLDEWLLIGVIKGVFVGGGASDCFSGGSENQGEDNVKDRFQTIRLLFKQHYVTIRELQLFYSRSVSLNDAEQQY